ncbi:outer membrane beta-barrel protein [Robiginitalea sediminis]|uniref:outer membrane beta-barrel protein n=1 Tax=Robiginitalea sediminis TaxID=1982593 RepID=UPI000B4B6154|nr:outer membrane beta-barrel protein [Robiginitalea sediminis]
MDQKQSDKYFRERLGNFTQEPAPEVWDRIRNTLDGKKKRRLIPLWWYAGGAAAILLLGLLMFNPFGEPSLETPQVTDTQTQEQTPAQSPATIPAPAEGISANPEKEVAEPTQLPGNEKLKGNQDALARTSPASKSSNEAKPSPSVDQLAENQSEGNPAASPVGNPDPGLENTIRNKEGVASSVQGGQVTSPNPANTGIAAAEPNEIDKTLPPAEEDQTEGKSLFEAIEEQEALAEATPSRGKWSIGPSVAPVYFNSFGDGSPISANFVPNSKSGTVNMSYGLDVAYSVNKRLSVRSGVHRVDFGYNTNEVSFTSTLAAAPSSLIRTISYSENSKNLVVHSTAGNSDALPNQNATDVAAPSPERQGRMVQQFGYLEVPLEVAYRLVDKRWGVNLIGGVSSLFLVDNSVSLDSDGAVTQVGEATNMNALNFSTNLGVGLYYDLRPSIQLRMQPMFKYHLNTFTETAGSFQPYSLGLYSGLSFRF